jgi:hypothetical protein
MTMKLYAVLGATLAMTLISTSALADCPYVFEGESCAGDTGSANCTRVADDEVECDFTPASQGVDAYFVSPTDTSFRAYGFDGDGDEFCCEFDGLDDGCAGSPPTPITIDILGSDYDDTLRLFDNVASLELDCSETTLDANAGDDIVYGSSGPGNHDILNGWDGSDTIRGRDGDDLIYGGYGDDAIWGEAGDDRVYAGYGADKIKGGAGDDELYGEESDGDKVCGEFGADKVDGGDGDGDLVFGGADTDVLNAGGAGAADNCEADSAAFSCELTSMTSCPW